MDQTWSQNGALGPQMSPKKALGVPLGASGAPLGPFLEQSWPPTESYHDNNNPKDASTMDLGPLGDVFGTFQVHLFSVHLQHPERIKKGSAERGEDLLNRMLLPTGGGWWSWWRVVVVVGRQDG